MRELARQLASSLPFGEQTLLACSFRQSAIGRIRRGETCRRPFEDPPQKSHDGFAARLLKVVGRLPTNTGRLPSLPRLPERSRGICEFLWRYSRVSWASCSSSWFQQAQEKCVDLRLAHSHYPRHPRFQKSKNGVDIFHRIPLKGHSTLSAVALAKADPGNSEGN